MLTFYNSQLNSLEEIELIKIKSQLQSELNNYYAKHSGKHDIISFDIVFEHAFEDSLNAKMSTKKEIRDYIKLFIDFQLENKNLDEEINAIRYSKDFSSRQKCILLYKYLAYNIHPYQ